MRKSKNKIISIIILFLIMIILIPKNVYAGMQANKGGTSLHTTTASDFFSLIRTMEAQYGTLGVEPDTGSSKNGIDAHMAKNTEWGTAAMLAVSSYGTGNASTAVTTTTGNASGVYNMGDEKWEYTANYLAGNTQDFTSNITGANDKYKDEYTSISSRIVGDGLNLSILPYAWNDSYPVLSRGVDGLLNYIGDFNWTYGYNQGGGRDHPFVSTRAVVVCGTGL